MKKQFWEQSLACLQIFMEDGRLVPVTVIQAEPNVVVQKKTAETDGYDAVQVGYLNKREKLANKPEKRPFCEGECAGETLPARV